MSTKKTLFSFPPEQRLTSASEYRSVFDRPKRISARSLIALTTDNTTGYARLGLAISRKHVKSAVKRNLIKRKVREFFRLHKNQLGSIDIVVLSGKQTKGAKKTHLNEALQIIQRALISA